MPSRHLVDPEVLPIIEAMPAFPNTDEAVPETRLWMKNMMPERLPPEDLDVVERWIDGPPGQPSIRLIVTSPRETAAVRPAILHIHGGGYIVGMPEFNLDADAMYARQLGAVVVSPAYRLAPETTFPGPVEDCYAALGWMIAQAATLGIDPDRIAISGESAGGGLAAALALLARDRKEHAIAFQHLIFPMIDDRTAVEPDPSSYAGQYVWTRDNNRYAWRAMLGREPGGPDVSPYAAAARAETLEGLPPTYIACGALDLFVGENLEYTRRLIRAGVPTEAHIYPGVPHAFMMAVEARVSASYHRDSLASLARALVPKS